MDATSTSSTRATIGGGGSMPARAPGWWSELQHPEVDDETSAAGRRFRHKFRLPYAMAMELVNEAQAVKEFRDKPPGEGGGRGPPRHPLVLKVLAVLRHLCPALLEICTRFHKWPQHQLLEDRQQQARTSRCIPPQR